MSKHRLVQTAIRDQKSYSEVRIALVVIHILIEKQRNDVFATHMHHRAWIVASAIVIPVHIGSRVRRW